VIVSGLIPVYLYNVDCCNEMDTMNTEETYRLSCLLVLLSLHFPFFASSSVIAEEYLCRDITEMSCSVVLSMSERLGGAMFSGAMAEVSCWRHMWW
jgi:hypothetical protein